MGVRNEKKNECEENNFLRCLQCVKLKKIKRNKFFYKFIRCTGE